MRRAVAKDMYIFVKVLTILGRERKQSSFHLLPLRTPSAPKSGAAACKAAASSLMQSLVLLARYLSLLWQLTLSAQAKGAREITKEGENDMQVELGGGAQSQASFEEPGGPNVCVHVC